MLSRLDADRSELMELAEFAELVDEIHRDALRGATRKAATLRADLHARDEEIDRLRTDAAGLDALETRHVTDAAALRAERAIGEALGAAEIRAAFECSEELRAALTTLGLDPSEQQAATLLQKYDTGGNGLLEQAGFAALVADHRHELLEGLAQERVELRAELARGAAVPVDVRMAFERFDAHQDGMLDAEELRGALQACVEASHESGALRAALESRDKFSDLVGALRRVQSQAMASELGSLRAQLEKTPAYQ